MQLYLLHAYRLFRHRRGEVLTDDDKKVAVDKLRWTPTSRLRYWRPLGVSEQVVELQQLYESVTGELEWREVPEVAEE